MAEFIPSDIVRVAHEIADADGQVNYSKLRGVFGCANRSNAKRFEKLISEMREEGVIAFTSQSSFTFTPTKKILGHTFRLMNRDDFVGFAGADEGDFICDTLADIVMIWSVKNSELITIEEDGSEVVWKVVRA